MFLQQPTRNCILPVLIGAVNPRPMRTLKVSALNSYTPTFLGSPNYLQLDLDMMGQGLTT